MRRSQLNNIALLARDGCLTSYENLLTTVVPIIEDILRRSWRSVLDEGKLADTLVSRIKYVLHDFNPDKGDFIPLLKKEFERTTRDYIKKRRRYGEGIICLDSPIKSKSGENLKLHDLIPDTSPTSEDTLVQSESLKEMATLLAESDQMKRLILKAWAIGFHNDSELARLLAQLSGGKAESYRKTIVRFRNHCKSVLATTA